MTEQRTQVEYWSTTAGEHWSEFAERYDEILGPFGDALVEAAGIQRGDRVVDIGCGNGGLSLDIARVVGDDGLVLGVDVSGPMLQRARSRASDRSNVSFVEADAQRYVFEPASFDRAVSRFGVMFFDDPTAAFTNIASAIRTGGTFASVCWQDALVNEWLTVPGMAVVEHVGMPEFGEPGSPGPFAFADADRVRQILTEAGLADVNLDAITLQQRFGTDVEDALAFLLRTDMAEELLADAAPATVEAVRTSLREALRPHASDNGVYLSGAAWLVTASKP